MKKLYQINVEVDGILNIERVELKKEERFSQKKFIKHLSEIRDTPTELIFIKSVKRYQ